MQFLAPSQVTDSLQQSNFYCVVCTGLKVGDISIQHVLKCLATVGILLGMRVTFQSPQLKVANVLFQISLFGFYQDVFQSETEYLK